MPAGLLLASCDRPSCRPIAPRRLIVTADDWGVARCVDDGIAAALNDVHSVSAMGNFPAALDSLADLQRAHPDLNVGAHLNIDTGVPLTPAAEVPSLVDAEGRFYLRFQGHIQPPVMRPPSASAQPRATRPWFA